MNCSICNNEYNHKYYPCPTLTIMKKQEICFQCAFWFMLAEKHAENSLWFRIAGESFVATSVLQNGQKAQGKQGKGFSGHEFIIEKFSDNERIRTDNLWYQGEMPPWFAKDYSDNARFIKQ